MLVRSTTLKIGLGGAALGGAALLALLQGSALASSHREAPSIAMDPSVDITDVYVFRTPGSTTHHTFVMNVAPGALSYAGPNWYRFDDNAIYEMHVDNTGDAVEDVTYQFQFKTNDYRGLGDNALIVANFPSITFKDGAFSGALAQTYTVTKIAGKRRAGERSEVLKGAPVAPPRIGPYTTDGSPGTLAEPETDAAMYAGYKTLSDNAIKTVGDGATASKWFAGPRNDPFYVDLGAVFDRVSPRIPGLTGAPRDALKGVNVLTIAFEVPDSDFDGGSDFFGVWATTSRPQATVLRTAGQAPINGGGYVQVSRLGNPLVNEVVIKINDKDKFNNTEPKDDVTNFAAYVTKPQLAYVLNVLYAGADGLTAPNLITKIDEGDTDARADLVAAFVTGLPGINKHPQASATGGDVIRVNKGFAIQEWPLSGRGLRDDVVEAALTFLAQCTKLMANTGQPANPFGKVDPPTEGVVPANCLLDDFVTQGDKTPGSATDDGVIETFPYVDLPHSAYYHRTDFPNGEYP